VRKHSLQPPPKNAKILVYEAPAGKRLMRILPSTIARCCGCSCRLPEWTRLARSGMTSLLEDQAHRAGVYAPNTIFTEVSIPAANWPPATPQQGEK